MESFVTVLSSGLLAAIVSATVARLNSERNILIDNITKERKSWRDKIRKISTKVFDSYYSSSKLELKKLKAELQLILNPQDPDDNEILVHFETLIEKCDEVDDLAFSNFNLTLSLLLKHDWERAKIEANPFGNVGQTADRMTFKQYEENKSKYLYHPSRQMQ